MFERILKILLMSAVIFAAYSIIRVAINANYADVSVPAAFLKAGECTENPTSQCFAELAILNLPLYDRPNANGNPALTLRYLGYGDVVDATMESEFPQFAESNRNSQLLFEGVSGDVAEFTSSPLIDDDFAYPLAYAFLQGDTGYFHTVGISLNDTLQSARARQKPTDNSAQSLALLRKWRASLDLPPTDAADWLRYSIRAREQGQLAEARESLAMAETIGLSESDQLRAVFETFHHFGKNAAIDKIERIQGTNLRAQAFLRLSERVLDRGDPVLADELFTRFRENYDREMPARHKVVWRHMSRRAALVAHRLNNTEQTESWADTYARESSFYQIPDRVRYSGDLYANVGLFAKSSEVARLAINHSGPVQNRKIRQSNMGLAVGLLCRAGEFEEAFALAAENTEYGRTAGAACFAAIADGVTPPDVRELERRLGKYSERSIRIAHAATLIERGQYKEASAIIERTLHLPPSIAYASRPYENVRLLLLAVAMRDEPLTRKIMRSIAADGRELSGLEAVHIFSQVAAFTKNWPDGHGP